MAICLVTVPLHSRCQTSIAWRQKGTGIAAPNSPLIISQETYTLVDSMKGAGYRTAVIGKWHLGFGDKRGPNWNGELWTGTGALGFDYHFLLPTKNDRVPQVFVQDRRVPNLDHSDPLWVGDKKPTIRHTLETQISPGVSDEVVCTIDLAASLSGTNLPTDACLDSLNFVDTMLGKPNAKGRDHLIQQDNGQAGKFGF